MDEPNNLTRLVQFVSSLVIYELGKCRTKVKIWWPNLELNQGHADFQSAALPTELFGRMLVSDSELICSERAYLSR